MVMMTTMMMTEKRMVVEGLCKNHGKKTLKKARPDEEQRGPSFSFTARLVSSVHVQPYSLFITSSFRPREGLLSTSVALWLKENELSVLMCGRSVTVRTYVCAYSYFAVSTMLKIRIEKNPEKRLPCVRHTTQKTRQHEARPQWRRCCLQASDTTHRDT